jgi:hypothetical protein
MVAPFNQAWMLLKQRGHELNLPPPTIDGDNPARSLSPQDLTDRRVDAASRQKHALNEIEMAGTQTPHINSMADAMAFLDNQRLNQKEIEDQLINAMGHEGEESHFERLQDDLDRQTLARMGQQPEADEMDAMGMPEMDETGMPMSRSIGGRGPAPNEGRAGSSGRPPVGSDDISNEMASHDPDWHDEYVGHLNRLGPFENPFTQKPVTTQHLQNSLHDWAAGAGRKAGKPDIVDRTYDEGGSIFDLNQMYDDDVESEYENEPLHENNPAAHNIASTNLRGSPRQNKRGQMDEPRVTPRMQGRAARSTSPFIGGQ